MLGKYLNGYRPERTRPPRVGPSGGVAGNGYPEFNYDLNQNGTVVHYDGKPTDYLTDVLSKAAVSFIKQPTETPFMIEVATSAPRRPYTPAPRDADSFPGLTAPRTAAFNATPGKSPIVEPLSNDVRAQPIGGESTCPCSMPSPRSSIAATSSSSVTLRSTSCSSAVANSACGGSLPTR
jgi:hypothetical protein